MKQNKYRIKELNIENGQSGNDRLGQSTSYTLVQAPIGENKPVICRDQRMIFLHGTMEGGVEMVGCVERRVYK